VLLLVCAATTHCSVIDDALHFCRHVVKRRLPATPQLTASTNGNASSSSSSSSSNLLLYIIQRLTALDTDSSVRLLAASILQLCLDTAKSDDTDSDSDSFWKDFFKHNIHWICAPFCSGFVGGAGPEELSAEQSEEQSEERASCTLRVCDLRTYLLSAHESMDLFLLENASVIATVQQLLRHSKLTLQVSCVFLSNQ
jgi:hypothetical protein